jgi:predicted metallopeptidase
MLNYTDLANQIVLDLTRTVREFGHIDPERILPVANARCTGRQTGNLAHCCSLRNDLSPTFSIWTNNGSRRIVAVSQWFRAVVPRVRIGGRPMLYMIQLRLPRILLTNPLETIVHELYHIGEQFDGHMRPVRHGEFFDSEVHRLMNQYLRSARGELPRLAQMTFPQLIREFRAVVAMGVPHKFKIPYLEGIAAPESYRAGVARLYPGHSLSSNCAVRRVRLNAVEPMRSLSERDLVLRHYDRQGVRRLPVLYARYARSTVALSA